MVLLEIGAIAVVVIIILFVITVFNGLISRRNRVQDAWAQIDVQLKRRYDLIPNLIETVKGYMKYEKGVLTQVTALRTSIMSGSVQDKATANNQLSQALKSIFAVAENYPDLKASETYKNLQEALEDTENKIAFVRTSYNDYVMDYNNAIQQVPGNMFAGPMHFQKMDYFQAPEGEKEPVKVDLTSDDSAPDPKQKSAGAQKK
ncbi:MAG: LemA family protein [Candidatus Micrarchaeota archaeon]|nr:LemA family protein [Candidatus Micrarchaeota archaeon]MDE1847815.1 LemA family protein [Candidatus Micrarchaeota archaeon]MDE1864379.1 LemA family protein [Candidatus Micrarchaeota archaeon]